MAIVSVSELSIGFRGPDLFEGINCQIDEGQRIGLLGRNGSGKTTFMRILCGEQSPDRGTVTLAAGKKISLLPQEVPRHVTGSNFEIVMQGWLEEQANGTRHHDDDDHQQWEHENAAEQILSRMQLDPEGRFESLSSGMKRRVLLAKSLVTRPDLLLLDEPTNHLDIDAIDWLEDFLLRWKATLIFVTHDRMFLRRLATRILEIDRGRMFDWSCDYDTFLKRKEAALAAEEKQDALFDKRLAEEEVWIRQGIKARRTRNEGRVRALKAMRSERAERREQSGTANLQIQEAQRSGALVAEIEEVSYAWGDQQIVEDFSATIIRGDKIGIVGPNGAGKTTLLRLMLGQLAPSAGNVKLGTKLEIAYFDQLRETLDPDATVQYEVGEGYDQIKFGDRSKHILGYLQDFLFTPERARTQIKFLSGGERNRILLAKLFAKPANIIVLDEPTNDLDTETLELLEQRLVEFTGTALIVSHDRAFLNNVVTSTIAFEQGNVREYDGGYDDWLRQRPEPASQPAGQKPKLSGNLGGKANGPRGKQDTEKSTQFNPVGKRRLSFNEQRELDSLPEKIEQLESEITRMHAEMGDPDYFKQAGESIAAGDAKLKQLQADLEDAFARWEELEATAS